MAHLQSSGARLHLPRPTIRLRLTIVYGSIFLISGAILLAITYALVSNATGNPAVMTSANGDLSVTYGGVAGTDPVFVTSTGGVVAGPQQLQALVTQQHGDELNQLLIWSIVALGVMAVASVWFGWLLAGRVLQPLRVMAADVREISATNLHKRLETDGPDDELKELGGTFDDLLGRLEGSFEAQRQFVANASHELRTPLARQRTLIQVALDDPNSTRDSLRATFERVLVAETQQEQLIEALLTLAHSERGLLTGEPVDLAGAATRVIDERRADIQAGGLSVDMSLEPATIVGNPRLVERLVTNLIDNAIRYNVPGGRIGVETLTRAGSAILRVSNSGAAISDEDAERLFDPFKRLGTARTGHGEGWGLGLSIVRAVAAAHGGQAAARSLPEGGLEIEISIPLQPSDQDLNQARA